MAVESGNIQQLMEWLAQDSPVLAGVAGAETLVTTLAAVVFQGDAQWTERPDQADDYRDTLTAWLATGGDEQQFAALTTADADPGAFVDWFLPVVAGWDSPVVGQQPDAEPGRYSEPARHDGYGLTYRYDNHGAVYEWFDEAGQTWQDQAWADQRAAGGPDSTLHAPAADAPAGPAATWDENWKMFYRVEPDGTYQFADALTPGDKASGCGHTWLSQEQVVARTAGSAHGQAQHQHTATHHQTAAAPATAHGGGELSGPAWADRFPQVHGGLEELKDAFRTDVEAFVAAMKAAGITVHIKDTMRSHKRAYLMHWSYLIMKGGVGKAASVAAEADADRFEGVDIRWSHTKDGGAFDADATVKAATELVARLDLDPKLTVAPARDSRHVYGHAVDMTTEWGGGTIKVLNAKNVPVEITTGPHTGMNPELWEVGKTYKVWHYGTWSSDMSAPAHDRNHWSIDGH